MVLQWSALCPTLETIENIKSVLSEILTEVVSHIASNPPMAKYDLEPDEQSKECHNKSLIDIPDRTIGEWLKSRFDVEIETRCDTVNYKIELK